VATIDILFALPNEAPSGLVNYVKSPLRDWQNSKEMGRKRRQHRFCQREAAASSKEFRLPAFEFARVFVNKWPDIGTAQPTGGKWKAQVSNWEILPHTMEVLHHPMNYVLVTANAGN
jgi:hypothetical protein